MLDNGMLRSSQSCGKRCKCSEMERISESHMRKVSSITPILECTSSWSESGVPKDVLCSADDRRRPPADERRAPPEGSVTCFTSACEMSLNSFSRTSQMLSISARLSMAKTSSKSFADKATICACFTATTWKGYRKSFSNGSRIPTRDPVFSIIQNLSFDFGAPLLPPFLPPSPSSPGCPCNTPRTRRYTSLHNCPGARSVSLARHTSERNLLNITLQHSCETRWKIGLVCTRSEWMASRISPRRAGGILARIRWLSRPFVVDHCVCTYMKTRFCNLAGTSYLPINRCNVDMISRN
mmetsp:Transcript_84394/g.168518  ORF Transcript_84394/g.168518 Transcript_84394/m.168518 type:complete len:296 (+) Transcript_84394:727-1614(+)